MKRITAIALFAMATMMTAGRAGAQAAALKADIPFTFAVNNSLLPAGSYAFSFDSMHPNRLLVKDRTKSVRATAFVERGLMGRGEQDTLTFHRYGDEYFLSGIRFESASDGAFLPPAKRERQAGKGWREELASITAQQ